MGIILIISSSLVIHRPNCTANVLHSQRALPNPSPRSLAPNKHMTQYILRRLLLAGFLIFMVATLVFLMMQLIPGDVVDAMLTEDMDASPELMEARRRMLGLDQPMHVQYLTWIGGFVRGDWGKSPFTGRPVLPDIRAALPRTLELVFSATIVAWLVGIPMGIFAAINHRNWLDFGTTSLALVGISTPIFVTGTMLILVFSLHLRWLPAVSGGYVSFAENPGRHMQQLILPTLSLGISMAAVLMQMTRAALLEVLRQDYVRTARAKGLSVWAVNWRHALKNALIPVVTVGGMQIGTLLGGTVIIEAIFLWPGVSTILINAVQRRDYPLVQGVVFVIASASILITLVVDVVNAYLDPRIRYS
ncbi:MAG: ABC transporter permease [Caldilineaceae bacterium]